MNDAWGNKIQKELKRNRVPPSAMQVEQLGVLLFKNAEESMGKKTITVTLCVF